MNASGWTLILRANAPRTTPEAADSLREVYAELRRVAARLFERERGPNTLEPTALVHEALLRLDSVALADGDRRATIATCARVMRHILIDRARRRRLQRDFCELLQQGEHRAEPAPVEVLDLDLALDGLEREHPQLAQVVELRWFLGRSLAEIADDLDLSERTVKRRWALARAWLQRHLDEDDGQHTVA